VKGVVAYPLIFRFLYSPISEFLGISIFLQDSTRASFLSLSETVSPICLRLLNDMMTKFGSSKRTKLAGVRGPEIIHGVTSLGIDDGLGRWCQGWGQLSPNRWLSEYIKDWVWLLSSFHKFLRSYHLHHASAPGINRMSNFFLGRRLNLS